MVRGKFQNISPIESHNKHTPLPSFRTPCTLGMVIKHAVVQNEFLENTFVILGEGNATVDYFNIQQMLSLVAQMPRPVAVAAVNKANIQGQRQEEAGHGQAKVPGEKPPMTTAADGIVNP